MTLWDYNTVTVTNGSIPLDDLVVMGKEGWELVTIISRPGLPERALFKRPLPAVKPKRVAK